MKTIPGQSGIEALLTLLLPGLLLTSAIALWIDPADDKLLCVVAWAKDAEFFAAFLLLAACAVGGAVVASAQAFLETFLLDNLTPLLTGIKRRQFVLDWHQYLDGLNRKGNPYVSRLVLFFQYETRLGLAGVTLAAPMMTYWPDWGRIVGVLSIFLYVAGVGHHIELAKYRRRLADS